MFNLYDKMVMDASSADIEAKIARKNFKHIGILKDDGAKVAIIFRTVPEEPENCLVIGPKFLSDVYHNAFMRALESAEGQASFELGSYLARQKFPDGIDMLALLHNDNYIKKIPTANVVVTYGSGKEGKIALNEPLLQHLPICSRTDAWKKIKGKNLLSALVPIGIHRISDALVEKG
jgi:hypothetical protein